MKRCTPVSEILSDRSDRAGVSVVQKTFQWSVFIDKHFNLGLMNRNNDDHIMMIPWKSLYNTPVSSDLKQ